MDNLENDYSIHALLNNYAIFSSRKNFNDLFDSKIELVRPIPKQLKDIKGKLRKSDRNYITELIGKGNFTPKGLQLIKDIEIKFTEQIDSYAFLSVSGNPISNLMWSHYAKSHQGFCIEFKSEYLKAEKVDYKKCIPTLNLLDLFLVQYNLIDETTFGEQIWESLRTKLCEWSYEDEYRLLASHSMGRIPKGDKFIKIPYKLEFVESIIFGCRMEPNIRSYIIEKMPRTVKFKRAVEKTSNIEIVDICP
ncbi:MAG: DUF2971 domain-containing protein [Methylovulum miyakonense]|uniref:DUF2971 domain-containing protein n=1 Tax=Methylovulum miyakonense TaxID=645578 RepID=UPI003BB5E043